ncbi:MAG: hypothetical protein WAV31_04245 [Candidatus Moraniibacteriota bacterium]
MKLLTISGLDGSGKSTQIETLKNYLESQNKRVFYFHAIEQGFAKKIIDFRNKYCMFCRLSGRCDVYREKSVTRASELQIILRRIFLMIDIWRFKKLHKKLEKENFDYILSDRYFYDSIINIYFLSDSQKTIPCEKFIKAPDTAIYLQADPQIIMSRDRKPDQGIDYLKNKKALYDKKTLDWNLKIINGNQEKEAIFEKIKSFL